MKKILLIFIPFIFSFSLIYLTTSMIEAPYKDTEAIHTNYLQNRSPLIPKPYLELPIGAIRPEGWLKKQLLQMKNGMTGQLDSLYSKVVGPRNGWLGGNGDVWERGPYWLDGLVPLAYILDDEELKAKVQPWIEWSIRYQRSDGYFGPEPREEKPVPEQGLQKDRPLDWWPKMVMLKVMKQYYSATGDKRVLKLMTDYFHFQLRQLPRTPLDHWSWWAKQRGGDNLMVVYWLYNITGDTSLLKLGNILYRQTYDWTNVFLNTSKLSELFSFHGVNLAQGIKEPVVYYQYDAHEKYLHAVNQAFGDMRRFIGQPQGMYGADELTHGMAPTQGAELCSVVELMFSLETIMSITGNVDYMDHLEKIAFNALPTQASDDYMTRQYYQQPNQVLISKRHRNFVTTHSGTDQCFGLLTGYPCCTTNMHQGWPKFTQHLWMASADNGVAALLYAPSAVKVKVADGTEVEFIEKTNYPFDNTIHFTYKSDQPGLFFPLHLRIPGWCDSATIEVNGGVIRTPRAGQIVKLARSWNNNDEVTLTLPMHISADRWYENSVAIERGPLVYALKIQEDWRKVQNEDHYGDYFEVYPESPWNYGLLDAPDNNWGNVIEVIKKEKVSDTPWNLENAPVELKVKGVRLPRWKLYNGSAGPVPYSPQPMPEGQDPETITLVPYGCTTLRITEFPVVRR